MEIHTQRLILREFRLDDFDALFEYTRDPEIHRYEGKQIPEPDAVLSYIQGAIEQQNIRPRTLYRFAITIPPDDRAVGRITLGLIYPQLRIWEIGWALKRSEWGKGYTTEAALEVLGLAFSQTTAHRVVAFCNANNAASYRVMEKIGMQREGRLRDGVLNGDEWNDEFVYGILEQEFKPRKTGG